MRRARASVVGAFTLHAAVSGTLGPRLPAVKEQAGLTDGELGVALAAFAVGLFVGTRVVGPLHDRLGNRGVLRAGMPLLGVTLLGPAFAESLLSLVAAFLLVGALSGILDVAMNANAVVVERSYGRPIMSSIHGTWSAGLLVASGAAAAAAALDVSLPLHFGLAALAIALVSVPALRRLAAVPDVPRERVSDACPRGYLPGTPVLLLGSIGFCSFLGEGAAIDWSAVYVDESLDASRGTAALAFVAFSVGITASRFLADRIAARLGPVAVLRWGATLAAAGLALGLAVPETAAAIAGFALLGAGLAPVVPTVFSAAGNTLASSGRSALATVVTISYLGSILGPALIGLVTSLVGLRAALGIPVLLALVAASLAGQVAAAPGGRRG
ncbi:MAG TPA: MFS transporter [Gaiellaceae bacterium]|nr:MFS transporter [Gaiellaceae bacterium]